MTRTFTALTTTVELDVDDDLAASELAAFLVAGYADATGPPDIAYRLRADAVVAVGRYDDPLADPADVVPVFERDLYGQVAERAAPGWLLHAAALENDGRAYMFAGPSGAGKTTLTLALVARGWRLVTDEMVLVDRTLAVRGLARPIHVPADGAQRRALPANWRQLEYPLRGASGSIVAQPPTSERVTRPLPLAAIARIGHEPNAAPVLEPLSAQRAIARLWDATLRQDDDGLAAAVAIAARIPVVELRSGSVDDAVSLTDQIRCNY